MAAALADDNSLTRDSLDLIGGDYLLAISATPRSTDADESKISLRLEALKGDFIECGTFPDDTESKDLTYDIAENVNFVSFGMYPTAETVGAGDDYSFAKFKVFFIDIGEDGANLTNDDDQEMLGIE